ncbi:cg1 protein, putative [Plasmodium ovale]|uniref:Cg1 protein, putative n=1 Tax=Plasmodium ovale TaxID=36330 RepID=A0A1C3KME1_PLAOA|nr:cg1 protein, putative [Plasmodium ovale]
MLIYLVITVNILVCLCFLNTKYQIQLDYSIPSELIKVDKSLKYTNITIGKDSFLCIFNQSNDDSSDDLECEEKYSFFKDVNVRDINSFVEEKLNQNYLLKYANNSINYKLSWKNERSSGDGVGGEKKGKNSSHHGGNGDRGRGARGALREEGKEKTRKSGVTNHHLVYDSGKMYDKEEVSSFFSCNFKKVYDYIFYKYKFNPYHKNRIYEKMTDQESLKNHIIKGKMLTINNICVNAFPSNENILKVCLNKSVSFITKGYNSKDRKKHVSISNYLSGKDLLFANNTVVQYYSDGKYFFEVLYICGDNNLRVNSFDKLNRIYYPLIFEIYEHVNTNLTKLYHLILKRLKRSEVFFFKTFSMYTYGERYYKALKNKLNEILNAFFPYVTNMYRITLSAYMFCDYTDSINPPYHYLLKNIMNQCYNFTENDDYTYEICLPHSVIKYKKDEYGKVKYPIISLGSSYVSVNAGKPFYEKTYDIFPVLKTNYKLKKETENYFKMKKKEPSEPTLLTTHHLFSSPIPVIPNSDEDPDFSVNYGDILDSNYSSPSSSPSPSSSSSSSSSSSTILSTPSSFPFPSSNPSSSTFNAFHAPYNSTSPTSYFSLTLNRIPYMSTYIIDKPVEVLKCGEEKFYKALAFDLKGGKCKDSLDEVYDYITTIYFDCSLHYKNEIHTKIMNVFQSTECHYYVHVSSPYLCAHPTLHIPMKSKKEVIKCFKNVYAASSQLHDGTTGGRGDSSNSEGNGFNANYHVLQNDDYVSTEDKLYLHEFYALKSRMNQNKNISSFEAVPQGKKIEFGKTYDFGLGNYIRKRVYKNNPIFHIGNIVRHKYWNYQAVVVSWDYMCFAPSEWKENLFSEYPAEFQNRVHYLILVNKKRKGGMISNGGGCTGTGSICERGRSKSADRMTGLGTEEFFNSREDEVANDENFHFAYVPESSLVYGDKMIYSEYLSQFFEKYNNFFHFYIPKKNHIIWKLFPYDFWNLIF